MIPEYMKKFTFTKEARLDIMDIWKSSASLLNRIFDITEYFKNDEIGLSAQVRIESYSVMKGLAKTVKSKDVQEAQKHLSLSTQALRELVATFQMAQQMGNIRPDVHQQTLDGYKILERKINRLTVDIKN